jgi:hypothetical protein
LIEVFEPTKPWQQTPDTSSFSNPTPSMLGDNAENETEGLNTCPSMGNVLGETTRPTPKGGACDDA